MEKYRERSSWKIHEPLYLAFVKTLMCYLNAFVWTSIQFWIACANLYLYAQGNAVFSIKILICGLSAADVSKTFGFP